MHPGGWLKKLPQHAVWSECPCQTRVVFWSYALQVSSGEELSFIPPLSSFCCNHATMQPCNWPASEWLHGCTVAGKCLEGG